MRPAIERVYPLLVGEPDYFDITLVGCGGTGSHLALALARLAFHVREGGRGEVRLTFVDGDRVEPKNIGRQNFSPPEVGRYKAETLAERFNRAFGLNIRHVNRMFERSLLSHSPRAFPILVGAVDNAFARRDIAEAVAWRRGKLWWLDCGNLYAAGQVLFGNSGEWDVRSAFPGTGFCHSLPSPGLLKPSLLRPRPEPRAESCAELTAREAQSLMVNQAMATFAGQYLYRLVVLRRLEHFMTVVDLEAGASYSHPIAPGAIEEAFER